MSAETATPEGTSSLFFFRLRVHESGSLRRRYRIRPQRATGSAALWTQRCNAFSMARRRQSQSKLLMIPLRPRVAVLPSHSHHMLTR